MRAAERSRSAVVGLGVQTANRPAARAAREAVRGVLDGDGLRWLGAQAATGSQVEVGEGLGAATSSAQTVASNRSSNHAGPIRGIDPSVRRGGGHRAGDALRPGLRRASSTDPGPQGALVDKVHDPRAAPLVLAEGDATKAAPEAWRAAQTPAPRPDRRWWTNSRRAMARRARRRSRSRRSARGSRCPPGCRRSRRRGPALPIRPAKQARGVPSTSDS